jgi:hypothetical protein
MLKCDLVFNFSSNVSIIDTRLSLGLISFNSLKSFIFIKLNGLKDEDKKSDLLEFGKFISLLILLIKYYWDLFYFYIRGIK